jgi:hypothetical protein
MSHELCLQDSIVIVQICKLDRDTLQVMYDTEYQMLRFSQNYTKWLDSIARRLHLRDTETSLLYLHRHTSSTLVCQTTGSIIYIQFCTLKFIYNTHCTFLIPKFLASISPPISAKTRCSVKPFQIACLCCMTSNKQPLLL